MVSDNPHIVIRQMTFSDIPKVVELQQEAFPGMPTWEAEELAHHLAVFPEGQLVAAEETGQILGSASSLIIDWDDYSEDAKWSTITGSGSFDTYNPLEKRSTEPTWGSIRPRTDGASDRCSTKGARSSSGNMG